MRKLRPKRFGDVEHDPEGPFPVRIATVHTRKGHGFWALSLRAAKRLRSELDKAIKRAAPREGAGAEGGAP